MFIQVPYRTSAAIEGLAVNPISGIARATFTDGYQYEYTNVSRRAIMNLLLNPNMSLGFWVNRNLVQTPRTRFRVRDFSVSPITA